MGSFGAGAFYDAGKAVGEFADAVGLAELDGLVGDQSFTNAYGNGAGADEVAGVLLIYSS